MLTDSRTFAFDYSKTPLPEEAFRNIADVGVRYRREFTPLDLHTTWDVNISSEGVVYIAHACEDTQENQTSLVAYNWMEDRGYICYDSQKYTLAKERALPHTKLHESIVELPDGRIAATTHSTSRGKDHPEWMPFAHMHHTWEGYPGSWILVYDPKTGEVENWGMPVPRESIYGMTYDAKYNCLYMIGFMRGHVYRFSIDDRTVKDLGKAAEVFCYRLHPGPDGHIYGMTKSGYLWRINVDTAQLEDMNWRHPAAYDNSWTNTWYRYMAKARNISDHEFIFHSYTSDEFYSFDTNTLKAYPIGKKFTHDDHNNMRHTEFCLNEFAVDKDGALWYQIMPVVLGHTKPLDYRKYVIPSYLMYWDIRNNKKPVNLGVISNNVWHMSYSTGVCYDKERDILHLVGSMNKVNEKESLLGVTSIELAKFRPVMMQKGAICAEQYFRAVPMNDEEKAKLDKAAEKPFPKYSGEEVPKGNPFQAFPIERITPIRLWREVPHTAIPSSKVRGLAWDNEGVLHGVCGDGKDEYYFTVRENLFEILGRTLEEVDENPRTWLFKGVFGRDFRPELVNGLYGVKPPKAFAYALDQIIPYEDLCEERKAWLTANLLPGTPAALPEGTKLPEVAGRRYLSECTYAVEWHDGMMIGATKDGLLGIVRPDGSVYNLGNCAPYGPVRCMVTNAEKTKLYGVAGDEEDMGMVFYFDEDVGIVQAGHLNYNAPNHMDGPSSANVLSCIALSKDGKNLAIGNIDRMGCVHIGDAAALRME